MQAEYASLREGHVDIPQPLRVAGRIDLRLNFDQQEWSESRADGPDDGPGLSTSLFESEFRSARYFAANEGLPRTMLAVKAVRKNLRSAGSYLFGKAARSPNHELANERLLRHQAEAAVRLRDEFLTVMAHELKQPLNVIHLHVDLLKRLPELRDSELALRLANIVDATVLAQGKIIDDLLDLSRVRSGKLALDKKHINLTAIASRMCEAFQPSARESGVALGLTVTHDPVTVDGDAGRIEQMLSNLFSNALKFTPAHGTVLVKVGMRDGMACLCVEDSGRGIPAEFLPKIFEMFSQVESGRNGLGIGLALVRELAESHGGRVEAHSDGVGRGARFRVWLPPALPLP